MYTLHIQYAKCTPMGFQKPEPVGVGPKLMCTSCGSDLANKKSMKLHIDRYLNDNVKWRVNQTLYWNRIAWIGMLQCRPNQLAHGLNRKALSVQFALRLNCSCRSAIMSALCVTSVCLNWKAVHCVASRQSTWSTGIVHTVYGRIWWWVNELNQ